MKNPIKYPNLKYISPDTGMSEKPLIWEYLYEYARLKCEYGGDSNSIQKILNEVEESIGQSILKINVLPNDPELEANEPFMLDEIRALRPNGIRRIWHDFDEKRYADKMMAALLARFSGCTLGASVEFWGVEKMKAWANNNGDSFPPVDYWHTTANPGKIHYETSVAEEFTKQSMNCVPADDDVVYTILGLLIMEEYGDNFSTENIGQAWLKYLPIACTAEEVALNNLKKRLAAEKVADIDNPYVQFIGAAIRSDPWGYMSPGLPEVAATYAYRDACLSHRRNGIYGEMYFSAVIAAAFAVDDYMDALEIGLTEIPSNCLFAQDVRWALEKGKNIKNYYDARKIAEQHFGCICGVHVNLNACLTIFSLIIGQGNFSKTIGECVAMGYDNDCNAATAGSILGACYGMDVIDNHWYANFNDTVKSYIIGHPEFKISDLVSRFKVQAEKVFKIF